MTAYSKSVVRTFNNNKGRFFVIAAILLLGIALITGLGALSPITRDSVNKYLSSQVASDVIIKSTSPSGFSLEQIDSIANFDDVESMQVLTSMDMQIGSDNSRLVIMNFEENTVNKLELVDGRFPNSANEIVIERSSHFIKNYKIGTTINILGKDMTIVGKVASPLIYSKDSEPDVNNQEALQLIAYVDSNYNNFAFPVPKTDIYIKFGSTSSMNMFSNEYQSHIDENVQSMQETINDDSLVYMTYNENKSYLITEEYTEKVSKISIIFSIFFMTVVALVVLTTMTRLIEEERSIIGCYKTLGYNNARIILKYTTFSTVSCLIGCVIGLILGLYLMPMLVYPGFSAVIFLPAMSSYYNPLMGILVSIGMIVVVSVVTGLVISNSLKEKPADLLRYKAPKPGKKIFLEKIPFIWSKTKFKYKSTWRNILRYKKHLIMTLVSVAGSMAIVFAGFSLYDASLTSAKLEVVADAVSKISSVIIMFACALCVLVIYNLTNMNIAERTRDIATLKVLGYHQIEVAGYIYREILIMALIGIALGVPLGCGVVAFLFYYLDIGTLASVSWWAYIASIAIILVLIGITDLLLLNKIKKVDMNTSLKSVD